MVVIKSCVFSECFTFIYGVFRLYKGFCTGWQCYALAQLPYRLCSHYYNVGADRNVRERNRLIVSGWRQAQKSSLEEVAGVCSLAPSGVGGRTLEISVVREGWFPMAALWTFYQRHILLSLSELRYISLRLIKSTVSLEFLSGADWNKLVPIHLQDDNRALHDLSHSTRFVKYLKLHQALGCNCTAIVN